MCAMRGGGRGFVNNQNFSPRGNPWRGHFSQNFGNRPVSPCAPSEHTNFRARSSQVSPFGPRNGIRPVLSPSHMQSQPNFHANSPPGSFHTNNQRSPFPRHQNPQFSPHRSRFDGPMNSPSHGSWRGNHSPRGQNHQWQRFPGPSPHDQKKRKQSMEGAQETPAKKKDKRDLPENNKFYCEICDRGYKDEEKYKEHNDSHVKCSVEGCPYLAAEKLVKLHYQTQHVTGLAKKIWQLESKEDLDKWVDDRKKNFPTAENIARKKALQAERLARGEVLETENFSRMNGIHGRGRGRGRGRGGRGRGRRWGKFDTLRDDMDNIMGEITKQKEKDKPKNKTGEGENVTKEKNKPETVDNLTNNTENSSVSSPKQNETSHMVEEQTDPKTVPSPKTVVENTPDSSVNQKEKLKVGDTISDGRVASEKQTESKVVSDLTKVKLEVCHRSVDGEISHHSFLKNVHPLLKKLSMIGVVIQCRTSLVEPEEKEDEDSGERLPVSGALGALASAYSDSSSDEEEESENLQKIRLPESNDASLHRADQKEADTCEDKMGQQEMKESQVNVEEKEKELTSQAAVMRDCKVDGTVEGRGKITGGDEENDKEEGEIDDDEDDDDIKDAEAVQAPEKSTLEDEAEVGGEDKTLSADGDDMQSKKRKRKNNRGRNKAKRDGTGRQNNQTGAVSKKRLTLLQRLLAPEIRHERNVILQCVRHIVQTDYLGVGRRNIPESKPSLATISDGDKNTTQLPEKTTAPTLTEQEVNSNPANT